MYDDDLRTYGSVPSRSLVRRLHHTVEHEDNPMTQQLLHQLHQAGFLIDTGTGNFDMDVTVCIECQYPWPCDTVRVMRGEFTNIAQLREFRSRQQESRVG